MRLRGVSHDAEVPDRRALHKERKERVLCQVQASLIRMTQQR